MGEYSKKGSYAGYDRDHLDRADLDYYATPPEEVENILEIEGLDWHFAPDIPTILEPCCGGGHMAEGIIKYLDKERIPASLRLWDLVDHGPREYLRSTIVYPYYPTLSFTFGIDLLDERLEIPPADYIIMNPPFKNIDKFVNAILPCVNLKLIMLARLKFVESKKRYEEVFAKNPPTRIYQYIDRIACYKDGDFSIKPNSIEAYAWFVWDKNDNSDKTEFKWIWSKKHK